MRYIPIYGLAASPTEFGGIEGDGDLTGGWEGIDGWGEVIDGWRD